MVHGVSVICCCYLDECKDRVGNGFTVSQQRGTQTHTQRHGHGHRHTQTVQSCPLSSRVWLHGRHELQAIAFVDTGCEHRWNPDVSRASPSLNLCHVSLQVL
eukprot:m.359569 g.359569  ORF g.359569 m.359569 type:complete len:102 (+) comp20760_c0_seq3:131-436(+)